MAYTVEDIIEHKFGGARAPKGNTEKALEQCYKVASEFGVTAEELAIELAKNMWYQEITFEDAAKSVLRQRSKS
jgi:hypothetical protein